MEANNWGKKTIIIFVVKTSNEAQNHKCTMKFYYSDGTLIMDLILQN